MRLLSISFRASHTFCLSFSICAFSIFNVPIQLGLQYPPILLTSFLLLYLFFSEQLSNRGPLNFWQPFHCREELLFYPFTLLKNI